MIELIFYIILFFCFVGLIYAIYEIIKNRHYYSPKKIWERMIEERESGSLSSFLLKLLGVKVPNVTSRKFDAIFILTIISLVIIAFIISLII